MRFCHPQIESVCEITNKEINTFVIENSSLMRVIIQDINSQIEGLDGKSIIEEKDKQLDFSKNAELFTSFIPFDINKKNLISKITSAIEKESTSDDHYAKTMKLLADLENYLDDITSSFDCNLCYTKLAPSSIIRAVGMEIVDDYSSLGEKIIDYMELVRQFDREKLFFMVNLRSFMGDDEIVNFFYTVITHEFKIIMFENKEYKMVKYEKRHIIDADLCEF